MLHSEVNLIIIISSSMDLWKIACIYSLGSDIAGNEQKYWVNGGERSDTYLTHVYRPPRRLDKTEKQEIYEGKVESSWPSLQPT